VESRLLGFPCFPYSAICTACFGSAFHKVTITAKARFGNRNHLSEMRLFVQVESSPLEIGEHRGVSRSQRARKVFFRLPRRINTPASQHGPIVAAEINMLCLYLCP
jgi:hypothetical protein